jgi:thioredoxin 1
MKKASKLWGVACIVLTSLTAMAAEKSPTTQTQNADKTVSVVWPGLASNSLTFAQLGELPEGVILRAKGLEITQDELDRQIENIPAADREQYRKNAFFALENMATRKLIVLAAEEKAKDKSEEAVIKDHLQSVSEKVKVTPREVAEFHKNNQDMFGGASLIDVKRQIEEYLRKEKQSDAIKEYIRNLSKEVPVTVSAAWAKTQADVMLNNPVDKARRSGKPTMVDFGADGCRQCDMMEPVLKDLKTKYAGKVNIIFVHVRKEKVLAARYAISGIPIQVFFDKDGREVYRHGGFFPQTKIEEQLSKMGVK